MNKIKTIHKTIYLLYKEIINIENTCILISRQFTIKKIFTIFHVAVLYIHYTCPINTIRYDILLCKIARTRCVGVYVNKPASLFCIVL